MKNSEAVESLLEALKTRAVSALVEIGALRAQIREMQTACDEFVKTIREQKETIDKMEMDAVNDCLIREGRDK